MALQVGHGRLDHVPRPDQPADPPPGHGVGLGHAVDDDGALGEGRDHHRQGVEPGVAVDEVLVDLVGQHPQAVLVGPPADRLDARPVVHRAGRVGRRHEKQHLGTRRASRLQLVDGDPEPGLDRRRHRDGHAAGEGDRLRVGHPVRRRDEDLVTGIEQRGEGLVHGLLAAVGDDHLRRSRRRTPNPGAVLARDRVAQLGQPRRRGVPVVAVVPAGGGRRLHDVVGRREVGLPGAEVDDRLRPPPGGPWPWRPRPAWATRRWRRCGGRYGPWHQAGTCDHGERDRFGPAPYRHPRPSAARRRALRMRPVEGAARRARRPGRHRPRVPRYQPPSGRCPIGRGRHPDRDRPALRASRRLPGGARRGRDHVVLGCRHARAGAAQEPAPVVRGVRGQVRRGCCRPRRSSSPRT